MSVDIAGSPEPQPTPCAWNIAKVSQMTLPTGDTITVLRLAFGLVTGQAIVFLTSADAIRLSDMLREQAGGLQIASDLPPGL